MQENLKSKRIIIDGCPAISILRRKDESRFAL